MNAKEWRKDRIVKGLCLRCDNEVCNKTQHCLECTKNMKENQRLIRIDRKAKGLCVLGCGANAMTGKVLCAECAKKNSDRQKKLYKTRKSMVVYGYGGKCQCVGCPLRDVLLKPEFLTIDHIQNDGKIDRLSFTGLLKFYKYIIDNNFPKDNYQLLCWNCNCAKSLNGGICPHQQGKG